MIEDPSDRPREEGESEGTIVRRAPDDRAMT